MNAAVVNSYDSPPAYVTFSDPAPDAGEQLVEVTAAGLHPIVKALANGTHYGSTGKFPFIPGVDGVGRLPDGTRVFFGVARPPYGTFSELAVAASWLCVPLPAGIEDSAAAGIGNPAMSGWVALSSRAKFVPGESVLILGATGSAGGMAVQIARRRGARRVVAAGRNTAMLEQLRELGADAVISLDQPIESLVAAFRREIVEYGLDIVLDYVWGPPAEALLHAIAEKGLQKSAPRVRYIQIGNSAGAKIPLAASILRSSGLELLGSGFGSASLDQIRAALVDFFAAAATAPFHFEVESVPLCDVTTLWNSAGHKGRLVFHP